MGLIGKSVGERGRNEVQDVKIVQRLLNKHVSPPLQKLTVDGKAGKHTIASIRHFQETIVKMRVPDGRVDPGGKTIRLLNTGAKRPAQEEAQSGSSLNGAKNGSNLSGAKWWNANQSKYRNRRGLEYLEGNFRDNASRFIGALRKAGAIVSVGSTRRHKIRAHLMHYSWQVSKGDVRASEVPAVANLVIEWDHSNEEESRKGAREMVRKFNMAHNASLTSNHIRGKAIDMTISWKGDLVLEIPVLEKPLLIRTGPRTGAGNRDLHRAGRLFGIKKLVKDPPHWSHNGR